MRAIRSDFSAMDDAEPAAETTAPVARPLAHLFGTVADPRPIPTLDSPQPSIRYERGSHVYATDGPVGTLRQVVIDEEMAEVKALVVRLAAKNESVLMPPDLVDKCVGGALLLNVTKDQFTLGASRSPRLAPRMFTGVDAKNVARIVPLVFSGDERRSVVSLSANHVETSDELEPRSGSSSVAPARSGWRRLLRRRGRAQPVAVTGQLVGGAG